jgi:uncharacterized membrane protein YhhN
MASSLTLVIAAWSFTGLYWDTNDRTIALLIAVGMTLGFIGDLFMSRLLPMRDYVLGGIGAFGLGHIAYIAAQINVGQIYGLFQSGTSWMPFLIWLIVGFVGWYVVVYRTLNRTALHYAALPYTLLLASTAGLATVLASQDPGFTPLAVGTALFLASDLILAARLFNNLHFYLIDDVVWLLYGPAQMLIVYSIGSAVTLPDLIRL